MFKQQFNDGLLKIQETFFSSNGGARYDKNLSDAIYSLVQKWRESTWKKAIEFMTYSFKPGYNCPLPVPADFKKVYGEIPLDEEYIPIARQDNGEYATPEEIAAIFEPLMKKIAGGKAFRLRTSHINGRFACEICFREGCSGASLERMKNGCGAYLSKEAAEEKAEIYKEERAYFKKVGVMS